MEKLINYLNSLPKGEITNTDQLITFLADCWTQFEGSDAEKMFPYKLKRMEDSFWDPPVLTFKIERHGGTVMGSTRAHLQHWTVDISTKTAVCCTVGYRQLYAQQPRLNVTPIADEIVDAIINHKEDERIKWNKDGSARLLIGVVLPETSGISKQTTTGRRKRLKAKIDEQLLGKHGWSKIRMNVYQK